MTGDLDVSELATAFRRLVLWFGAHLILVAPSMGLQQLAGEGSVWKLMSFLLLTAGVVMEVVLVYYGYRTAKALGSGAAWVWGIAVLVPVLNLVILVALNLKATRACKAHGVPVGFFGPKAPPLHAG